MHLVTKSRGPTKEEVSANFSLRYSNVIFLSFESITFTRVDYSPIFPFEPISKPFSSFFARPLDAPFVSAAILTNERYASNEEPTFIIMMLITGIT